MGRGKSLPVVEVLQSRPRYTSTLLSSHLAIESIPNTSVPGETAFFRPSAQPKPEQLSESVTDPFGPEVKNCAPDPVAAGSGRENGDNAAGSTLTPTRSE